MLGRCLSGGGDPERLDDFPVGGARARGLRIRPAIFASLLSFLAYNFFFIEPRHTFTIAQPHELLRSSCSWPWRSSPRSPPAACASRRASIERPGGPPPLRVLAQALRARRGRRRGLGYRRRGPFGLAAAHRRSARSGGELELRAAWPPEDALDPTAMTAARWALQHNEPAGAATKTLPLVPWYFVPLRAPTRSARRPGRSAARGSVRPRGARAARHAHRAVGRGARSGHARARRGDDADRRRDGARAQHAARLDLYDFRTPLASILGSASTLLELADSSTRRRRGTCSVTSRAKPKAWTRWCATCS